MASCNFSLRGILWYRLCFGFYFKCSNSVLVCRLTKLYCILLCLFMHIHFYELRSVKNYLIDYIATLYDIFAVIEVITNVVISLVTEERFVTSFASKFNSNPSSMFKEEYCRVTYFVLFGSLLIKLPNFFILYSMDGNVLLTNIMFAHRLIGCYNTRLTIIYLAENYQNFVRNLCKSLKQKMNEENLEEIEKSKHVKQFIIDFTQLTNNFEDTRLIQSVKVRADFYKTIFQNIILVSPWI